ncbi:MAG: rod shape-determining protein MreC [Candidatus Saccharimonadales bacterium]
MNKTKVIVLSAIAIMSLLLFMIGAEFKPLANIINPLGQRLHNIGVRINSASSELFQIGTLNSEINQQQDQIIKLQQQLVDQQLLELENKQLREELGFIKQSDFSFIPADVINNHPDQSRRMIRINLGSDDGVETDMSVVSRGVLVGVIDDVSSSYSRVVLVNDIDFRALVDVGELDGVLRGYPGGGLVVDRLLANNDIAPGDLVYTNGRDGIHPRGLLVGAINSINSESGDIFSSATIEYALPSQRLTSVLVIHE